MRNFLTMLAAVLCVAAALSIHPQATPPDVAADGLAFPRLAIVYYGDQAVEHLDELAQWDLWIGAARPEIAAGIREYNPEIRVLTYQITTEDCAEPRTFANYLQGFRDDWWLRSSTGEQYTFWRGCPMVNQSAVAPLIDGQRFNEYFANYVFFQKWLPSNGSYDGIFFDNTWGRIDWKAADHGDDIDLNRDGGNDLVQFGREWVNEQWSAGYLQMLTRMRELIGPDAILLGGDARTAQVANGRLWEDWPNGDDSVYGSGWYAAWQNYQEWQQDHFGEFVYVVLTYPETRTDYRSIRFGLASTLLGDGYFAVAAGVDDHTRLWWYDEYSVDPASGWATGDASSKGYLGFPASEPWELENGVWRREFDNGIVLLNPTPWEQTVELGGIFRKIHGIQDPKVNNGATVSQVTLPPEDGLILLRPYSTLAEREIPGNLLDNGRFEKGAEGWGAWHAELVVDDRGRFGQGARVTYTPQNASEPHATTLTLSSSPGIEVDADPGTTFRASAWVRGQEGTIGKPLWLVIRQRSPDGETRSTYSHPVTLKVGWQQVWVRHQVPRPGPAQIDVHIQLNDAAQGDVFYVDDVSLVDFSAFASQASLPYVRG